MSKTYRALAIVAVVLTLASLIAGFTSYPQGAIGGVAYAAVTASSHGLLFALLTGAWLATGSIAGPIVSTFGAVVAGQARRWGWMIAFIALGALILYEPMLLLEWALIYSRGLFINGLYNDITILIQILPAIVALLFVATTSRPARITSGQPTP